MFRAAFTLIFVLLSFSSHALTPFEQHFLSVTKGMSAFYMYLLSGEDKKFKKVYETAFSDASTSLYESSNPDTQTFVKKWNELKPSLRYENKADMGASINENIRGNFRSYVVDLYLEFSKQNKNDQSYLAIFKRIQLYSQLLTARALDVDSTIYGIGLFTQHDYMLDQKRVFDQMRSDLTFLSESKLPNKIQIEVRRIQAKLKFMEASLVDYDSQSATYLLYQNALSIGKIVSSVTEKLEA